MKYYIIPKGTRCEFEIYEYDGSLCEIHRCINMEEIVFNENDFIEECDSNEKPSEFMRFSHFKNKQNEFVKCGDRITGIDDLYECVFTDTVNVRIEER